MWKNIAIVCCFILMMILMMLYISQRYMETGAETGGYRDQLPLGNPDWPPESNQSQLFCEECLRMRHLLSDWPSNKPKGVIYILTQEYRLGPLMKILNSLDEYFISQYAYPIVIFYEEMASTNMLALRNTSHTAMFFQKVHFSVPSFLVGVQDVISCRSTMGYRHMCRFHAKGVYKEEILQGFDYLLRLDDDSLITRNIPYDIFQVMQLHDYLYGYVKIGADAFKCTVGLWKASERYISDYQISTQFFSKWKNPKIFYNNFEVSAARLWRSHQYQHFIDYIDHLGGIYYHRWGDAPIKGIAVSMFVPEHQAHHFKDIGYSHGKFAT